MIHVGAASEDNIRLESGAKRNGYVACNGEIPGEEDFSIEEIKTNIDIYEIRDRLCSKGIKIETSDDAGR